MASDKIYELNKNLAKLKALEIRAKSGNFDGSINLNEVVKLISTMDDNNGPKIRLIELNFDDYEFLTGLKDVFGVTTRTQNGEYVITINKNQYPTRKRFTIAHEIGHILLDKNFKGNNICFRSDVAIYNDGKLINKKDDEYMPNSFAGELLVPTEGFLKLYEDKDIVEIAQYYGVSVECATVRYNQIFNR